jgi:hypothetical protein
MMNEVDDAGQEPTDNPQRWSAKWSRETDDSPSSSRSSARAPRDEKPARPGGSSARAPRDEKPARPGGSSPRAPRDDKPTPPGGSSPRPDMPVRVRIVWDARIPSPVARWLGQGERDLFHSLVSPDPGARKVRNVQHVDLTLSGEDVFVVDSPALPHIVVGKIADAINVLLVPARPDPFLPAKISPLYDMEPASPVRKPGSDFWPTV